MTRVKEFINQQIISNLMSLWFLDLSKISSSIAFGNKIQITIDKKPFYIQRVCPKNKYVIAAAAVVDYIPNFIFMSCHLIQTISAPSPYSFHVEKIIHRRSMFHRPPSHPHFIPSNLNGLNRQKMIQCLTFATGWSDTTMAESRKSNKINSRKNLWTETKSWRFSGEEVF